MDEDHFQIIKDYINRHGVDDLIPFKSEIYPTLIYRYKRLADRSNQKLIVKVKKVMDEIGAMFKLE
jgi:hypothetical protein